MPGLTVEPSESSPADLVGLQKFNLDSAAGGLQMWESRMRFPSLAFFAMRQLQASGITCRQARPATDGDRFLLWPTRPCHASQFIGQCDGGFGLICSSTG